MPFKYILADDIRSNDLANLVTDPCNQYWLVALVMKPTESRERTVIAFRDGVKRKFRLTGDEEIFVSRTRR